MAPKRKSTHKRDPNQITAAGRFDEDQAIAPYGRCPGLYRDYCVDVFDLIRVDECRRASVRDDRNSREILDYFLPTRVPVGHDRCARARCQPRHLRISRKSPSVQRLHAEQDRVFPGSESLIQVMRLEERFKDVTLDTLNREEFLQSSKEAFPSVD